MIVSLSLYRSEFSETAATSRKNEMLLKSGPQTKRRLSFEVTDLFFFVPEGIRNRTSVIVLVFVVATRQPLLDR
jgi:hypothetical protein